MFYLFFKDLKNYAAKLHLQNFNIELFYRLILIPRNQVKI